MGLPLSHWSFEGLSVGCRIGGAGLPLLLIHGSGPGASTIGNWRLVLEDLANRYHVHAMDLVGFGESDRKPAPPYFDFELWLRQCRAMIARMPGERIGIIGHSISGALALRLAASEPRVAGVLATGTMGAPFALTEGTRLCWTYPETRADLLRAARALIADEALIDEAYVAAREAVLRQSGYGAYFNTMFGGDKQAYIDAAVIPPAELARITCPVTLLHGRADGGFPAEPLSLALARHLPQADVVLLGGCSHSIAMERPGHLLDAARRLFG